MSWEDLASTRAEGAPPSGACDGGSAAGSSDYGASEERFSAILEKKVHRQKCRHIWVLRICCRVSGAESLRAAERLGARNRGADRPARRGKPPANDRTYRTDRTDRRESGAGSYGSYVSYRPYASVRQASRLRLRRSVGPARVTQAISSRIERRPGGAAVATSRWLVDHGSRQASGLSLRRESRQASGLSLREA